MALVITLAMTAWVIFVILFKGLNFFWPGDIVSVDLQDGKSYMGELWDENETGNPETDQLQLKIGNRDIYGLDFIWLNKKDVTNTTYKNDAVTFEREEYGNFYGVIQDVHINERYFDNTTIDFFDEVEDAHKLALETSHRIEEIRNDVASLMIPSSELQREIALIEISSEAKTEESRTTIKKLYDEISFLEQEIEPQILAFNKELEELVLKDRANYLTVQEASGQTQKIAFSSIVRLYQPNEMGVFGKSVHYIAKVWEFVADYPRESNTEGGVFPAIFGTVLMVLLMSIAVVPIGVMAAIYLNEYANQGTIVRFIRLSVNNLAGVPSIVFGVFGLGFFVYVVGGSIDQLLFSDTLPEPTFGTGGILWASLTLALLTLPVVVVATEEGILAVPRANKEGALALGATKWQMIRNIVLPNAMPGILTGLILAISRGAGEVAPLMITGVVKLAPSLALDWSFPFLHLDRKFMHLGFHIYDVGFQSPNVEAAKPMVYSTALLLIIIVVLLNMFAIYVRNNLRKKFKTATF
ncbi:MAG: phosphate ABC transporter permease PstA [Calditrichaeota bacterium]|nr:MAG: phosphate ABC transporter permease PtsA [Calditrichota bacterium]MBL1207825.1 phosphate ABC transporter permease PstA [Calditrichota bacterium]NOG47659.1 phosphate ABC transporter permease PstA [Calditrichota bacterium]